MKLNENTIEPTEINRSPLIRKNSNFEKLKRQDQLEILTNEDRFIQNKLQNFMKKTGKFPFEKFGILNSKEFKEPPNKTPICQPRTLKIRNSSKRINFNTISPIIITRKNKDDIIKDKRSIENNFKENNILERNQFLKKPSEKNNQPIHDIQIKKNLSSPNINKKNLLSSKDNNSSKFDEIYNSIKDEPIPEDETDDFNLRKLQKMKNIYDSLSDDEITNSSHLNNVLHPNSFYKWIWDFVIYFLLYLSIVISPLTISFIKGYYEQTLCNNYFLLVTVLDILIDIIFFLDVIFNFFIGYYDFEEQIICNHRKVIINYLSGYFYIDVLSALPLNTIIDFNFLGISWRWLKLLRLIKYIKFQFNNKNLKHKKIVKRVTKKMDLNKLFYKTFISDTDPKVIQLIGYIFNIAIFNHILTCLWIYVSHLSPEDNWKKLQNYERICYYFREYYIGAFYFTMATFFTVGFGDIHSISIQEKLFNICLLIISLIIYSFFVSFLSNFSVETNPKKVEFNNNIDFLKEISFKRRIRGDLYRKIKNYFKYTLKNNRETDNNFISQLPKNIRNQMICQGYREIIKNFKFLKNSNNNDFNVRIILSLRPICAYKNEKLFERGNLVEEIIFIRNGRVGIYFEYKKHLIKLINLFRYEHFGDYFALKNERPSFDLIVKSETCELFLLRKQDFLPILEDFIDTYSEILDKALYNMNKLKKLMNEKKKEVDFNFKKKVLKDESKPNSQNQQNIEIYKESNPTPIETPLQTIQIKRNSSIIPVKKKNTTIQEIPAEEEEEDKEQTTDMFKFNVNNKLKSLDEENILNKQIKKHSNKKKEDEKNTNKKSNKNVVDKDKIIESNLADNDYNTPTNINNNTQDPPVNNPDDKVKISYKYNYYNNYNITNSGNLFINLNIDKSDKIIETPQCNMNNSNLIENNCNTFLQFNSNKVPIITISDRKYSESDSSSRSDSEPEAKHREKSTKTKKRIKKKSMSQKESNTSLTNMIYDSSKDFYFSQAKTICNDYFLNKNLKRIKSKVYTAVIDKLDHDQYKKLNIRMKHIYKRFLAGNKIL
jgi:CRP-like cAMP-binding protein